MKYRIIIDKTGELLEKEYDNYNDAHESADEYLDENKDCNSVRIVTIETIICSTISRKV